MIGPRALLLEELSRLKAQSRRVQREASIWEADEHDGRSDCDKLKACNCCFPWQLDHYKLTSAYLVVRRTHQTMCCCVLVGGVCGAVTQTQNSMDLSQIRDIDTSTVETGACCWFSGALSYRVPMLCLSASVTDLLVATRARRGARVDGGAR